MVKKLDFIVIGAQKAGTTSLYHYLKPSPEVYLPPEKEAPFFYLNKFYENGWEWYVKQYFSNAPENRLWGKVTPSYMSDLRVPERLYQEMPNIKLIVLLRNPIDRAISHYKMAVKRGEEKESFSQVLSKRLEPSYLGESRSLTGETKNYNANRYFVLGEYGRILEQYFSFFKEKQILVLFTENLSQDPKSTLICISNFLGIDYNYQAPIHRRYHVGGTKTRLPWKGNQLTNSSIFQFFMSILPDHKGEILKRRFLFWYNIWNTMPDPESIELSESDRKKLTEFYYKDVKKIQELLSLELIPWEEFK